MSSTMIRAYNMKAVVIHQFVSDYDEVVVSEVEPPKQQDSVIIQVKAAGVNFVDTLYARGKHQNNRSLVRPPFTLGLEFAGTILSVPASAPADFPFRAGDHVFGDGLGAYSEQVALSLTAASQSLHLVPPTWSFADAAGLAATLPVSYGALIAQGGLKPGETVLVLGAAGGLGVMAVQVAATLGCRVIGVAAGAEKCAVVKSCGAEACVDYSVPSSAEWWMDVNTLTDGCGVDVVFDPIGMVEKSLKCLAHRGRILIVGFAARDETSLEKVPMNRVLLKQAQLIGYRYGESSRRYPEEKAKLWKELQPFMRTIRATRASRPVAGLSCSPFMSHQKIVLGLDSGDVVPEVQQVSS
ncbi:putative alcohol dehydrogenase protein [Phaeoacremonium minimum UCRPA7]|uniref:Putative alcohol dehydrogenase protein n=1 Tax=Phaeoacremonium minimum (strain UCR-PA7) TaxID=1286976 RepID=R8BN44_PHAM7|nr:putative alcohol dehydrogenase protein [Phaeoacremonium minimum UCRPA7]EOO00710.1 putative alcohol dehydrogenase protein [Phaeoacremonium minimum UCRPA7]